MDIIGIGYMGFETANLDVWREYGPQVMGFGIGKSPESDPQSLYFRIDDRRHRFAFHPGKVDRLAYIGWEALGRMAFEDGLKARSRGCRIHPGRRGILRVARGARSGAFPRSGGLPV